MEELGISITAIIVATIANFILGFYGIPHSSVSVGKRNGF
jgi:hypothetical protein